MTEAQVLALLGTLAGLFIAALTIWKFIQSHIHHAVKDAKDQASSAGALATLTQNLLAEHQIRDHPAASAPRRGDGRHQGAEGKRVGPARADGPGHHG